MRRGESLLLQFLVLAFTMGAACESQGALFQRGPGMIYDSVNDVTWITTLDLTAEYGTGDRRGRLTWEEARRFVSELDYGGYDDWRLPRVQVKNWSYSYSGSDFGSNVSTTNSELAFMYHNNLGNESRVDSQGETRANRSVGLEYIDSSTQSRKSLRYDSSRITSVGGTVHATFWTQTEPPGDSSRAIVFDFYQGIQAKADKTMKLMVWAVRDGDSVYREGSVPAPEIDQGFSTTVNDSLVTISGSTDLPSGDYRRVQFSQSGTWQNVAGTDEFAFKVVVPVDQVSEISVRAEVDGLFSEEAVVSINYPAPDNEEMVDYGPHTGEANEITTAFTASNGRSLLLKYSHRREWDTRSPRGVLLYFHGNSVLSDISVLNVHGRTSRQALGRGLIPITVASPDMTESGKRFWSDDDIALIDELIQTGVGNRLAIDTGNVYLWGGSQGTCFLHGFTMAHLDDYQGGVYGDCGCWTDWPQDASLVASQSARNSLRIVVQNTTEDFLFESGQSGYGYYKYTLGLETMGFFDTEGPHCGAPQEQDDIALDWLTGVSSLESDSASTYWKRISTIDKIIGMAEDNDGSLWIAQQNASDEISLWRKRSSEENWSLAKILEGVATGFNFMGNQLFLSLSDGLYSATVGSLDFDKVSSGAANTVLLTDGSSLLFDDARNRVTTDGGITWNSVSMESSEIGTFARYLPDVFSSRSTNLPDSAGRVLDYAFFDGVLWVLTQSADSNSTIPLLYRSPDQGRSFTELDTSFLSEATPRPVSAYGPTTIAVTRTGDMILLGGSSTWVRWRNTVRWERIYGAETVGRSSAEGRPTSPYLIHNRNDSILLTDGEGMFELVDPGPGGLDGSDSTNDPDDDLPEQNDRPIALPLVSTLGNDNDAGLTCEGISSEGELTLHPVNPANVTCKIVPDDRHAGEPGAIHVVAVVNDRVNLQMNGRGEFSAWDGDPRSLQSVSSQPEFSTTEFQLFDGLTSEGLSRETTARVFIGYSVGATGEIVFHSQGMKVTVE